MGNNLAYIALLAWPIFIIFFFNKFEIRKALLFSIFGSYLFLPASFQINLPGIPAFDKTTVTTITLFLILFFKGKGIGFKQLDHKTKIMLMLLLASPFITAMLNSSRYLHLPGVTLYDGLSQSVSMFLVFIPFLLGVRYFNDLESQKLLFKYTVLACLIYVPLMLFEVRMSPQLHSMVYGFFPHSFVQQIRSGGFRPVVFLGHGLLVALFVAVSMVAMLAFMKSKISLLKISNISIFFILFITLILSKTYGALLLFSFAAVLIYLFKLRFIGYFSILIMLVYLSYPIMSANNLFPHDKLVATVEAISSDRAQSLNFRFYHERQLLEHANNKPLFGWSSWGRNRVYNPETFEDLSVTDGRWIITLGTRGWFGFLTEFYFIFITIWLTFKLSKKERYLTKQESMFMSGHLLIVLMILIDQIPNASLSYYYWLFIGSLFGCSKNKIENLNVSKVKAKVNRVSSYEK